MNLSAMTRVVYNYEKKYRIPETDRLTEWPGYNGMVIPKATITEEQIKKRYEEIKNVPELTSSKINIVGDENSKTLAFATIEVNGYLLIKNVRIMDGENGAFVSYPSYKSEDGTYKDNFHFMDKEARKEIEIQLLKAYIKEQSIRYLEEQDIDVICTPITDQGATKGLATVTLDNSMVIHNIRVMEGKNGLFISYPQQKTTTGDYAEVITPAKHMRNKIEEKVLEEYKSKIKSKEGIDKKEVDIRDKEEKKPKSKDIKSEELKEKKDKKKKKTL